jgi:hypothetical protein
MRIRELVFGDQVVERQKPAHHHVNAQVFLGFVFNVSSHLYYSCCGSDYM